VDILLQKIFELQEKHGLNDRQFALELGIDPATWHRIKTLEINPPTTTFLSKMMAKFPEMSVAIMQFLHEKGIELTKEGNDV